MPFLYLIRVFTQSPFHYVLYQSHSNVTISLKYFQYRHSPHCEPLSARCSHGPHCDIFHSYVLHWANQLCWLEKELTFDQPEPVDHAPGIHNRTVDSLNVPPHSHNLTFWCILHDWQATAAPFFYSLPGPVWMSVTADPGDKTARTLADGIWQIWTHFHYWVG